MFESKPYITWSLIWLFPPRNGRFIYEAPCVIFHCLRGRIDGVDACLSRVPNYICQSLIDAEHFSDLQNTLFSTSYPFYFEIWKASFLLEVKECKTHNDKWSGKQKWGNGVKVLDDYYTSLLFYKFIRSKKSQSDDWLQALDVLCMGDRWNRDLFAFLRHSWFASSDQKMFWNALLRKSIVNL